MNKQKDLTETISTNINKYGILNVMRECLLYNSYVTAVEDFDIIIIPELFM